MLGPLQVWTGTAWTGIRAAQPRLVLAVLVAERGQSVSTERLVDEVWGDTPPRTAVGTVQVYVMRLRRLLQGSPVVLATRGHGYRLVAEDGAVDAALFERGAEAGRRTMAAGQTRHGVDQLAGALDLWRGRPFADVPVSRTVAAEADRLEQLRLDVAEERYGAVLGVGGAALELGGPAQLVDELAALVRAHPFRERLHALLMDALYRCGRRAEAVAAYHRLRSVLLAELDLEPGPEVRRLYETIQADGQAQPSVDASRPAGGVPGFVGRRGQLAQLDSALEAGTSVVAIEGMAGVGKTALAAHWAHRVRDRFPGGVRWLDLSGHGTNGTARGSAPPGGRSLLLLDHARDAEQVRPLISRTPGCLHVVTSRGPLDGLGDRAAGVARIRLDVLSPDEAGRLLEHLVGVLRVRAEPRAAAELARACAYLPLALRLAAVAVAGNPGQSMADCARLLTARPRS
ncbi:BTAD domain-containing putative transcriptional regulator [Streptomyces sp. NPDC051940]|uniref:AfsR/SARP family transcriptional regulator n=1 Tax=Streptomyces sp. NPDC051940 TaxID=3155675 RepID=UPI0034207F63